MVASAETVGSLSKRLDQADLERQQDRSNLASHEEICAANYKALEKSNNDLKVQLEAVVAALKVISDAQIAATAVREALAHDRPKWWHQIVGGAVIALIGWMGATIWNMNNARVDTALQRNVPAASVTVNPPRAEPESEPAGQ